MQVQIAAIADEAEHLNDQFSKITSPVMQAALNCKTADVESRSASLCKRTERL